MYVPIGTKATTQVVAIGDDLIYQWYIKNKNAKKFTKSSVTKPTYSVTMSDAVDGRRLYCVVSDMYGNTATSNTITLHTYVPLYITSQPKSVTVANGEKAMTSVFVSGSGLTYQWYVKNKTATKFSQSSVTKNTYSVTMSDAVDGRQVYCIITDSNGNFVLTDTVVLQNH